MDSRKFHKRRHHPQVESPYHHAEEKEMRNLSQCAEMGLERHEKQIKIRGRQVLEPHDSLSREDPWKDYVQNWLAQVTEENLQGKRESDPSRLHDHSPQRQTRKYVCQPFEFSRRNDSENNREINVSNKRKGHASSDSSLLQPVYSRTDTRHEKLIPAPESIHVEQHRRLSRKSNKKHNELEIYSSNSDNQSESDEPQHKETFEKRKRHKTKTDRYESKKKAKPIVEEKHVVKKVKKVKRGDAAKASRKAGEDLVRSFTSKNIAQERLTMRPGTGIFRNGRASSPSRHRGLPDLAFSEMQFLKHSNKPLVNDENEVITSKSGQKTKRERERARNEISNYFVPGRQPLRDVGNGHGGREKSTLPSDAGRSEVTSIVRRNSFRPTQSPPQHKKKHKELYLGFNTGLSSPQKFSLPETQSEQIFVPKAIVGPRRDNSSKSTSYCSWSETRRSPSVDDRSGVAPDGHQIQPGSSSPATLQRMLIQSGIFKGTGIQAKLYPRRESVIPAEAVPVSDDGHNQRSEDLVSRQAAFSGPDDNVNHNRPKRIHEDSIHQFQAERAVPRDCEAHVDGQRGDKVNLENSPVLPRRDLSVSPHLQNTEHIGQIAMEQYDPNTGWHQIDRTKEVSPLARHTNPQSGEQDLLSRAVLAQKAYINRRQTPKVIIDDTTGGTDAVAFAEGGLNARDPIFDVKIGRSEAVADDVLTIPQSPDRQDTNQNAMPLLRIDDEGPNKDTNMPAMEPLMQANTEGPLETHEQEQSAYFDADDFQATDLDIEDCAKFLSGENDVSHQFAYAASDIRQQHENLSNAPQMNLQTHGFSASINFTSVIQPRVISPLSIMEPIYGRQFLHNQTLHEQEEQREQFYNVDNHGQDAVYKDEEMLWGQEQDQEWNGIPETQYIEYAGEEGDGVDLEGDVYADVYNEQQYDMAPDDGDAYYADALPLDIAGQIDGREYHLCNSVQLFESETPSAEYLWMPRARRFFSGAGSEQHDLEALERERREEQRRLVPRERLGGFWQPRRGY